MNELSIPKKVEKFVKTLPKKHQAQIRKYLFGFKEEPRPHDSKTLKGYEPYRRGDCGEYRIIYDFDESKKVIHIILIGKRNDDEVYHQLKNLFS